MELAEKQTPQALKIKPQFDAYLPPYGKSTITEQIQDADKARDNIWKKQPIKEVILGPNCKTDIKEFDEFLESNGVLCKAVKSKIKNRK